MKKVFSVLMIISLVFLSACGNTTEGLTAEEVVKEYFTYFNNKDLKGMDTLVVEDLKGRDPALDKLNYVSLMKTDDTTEYFASNLSDAVLSSVYDVAVIDVAFDIVYNDNPGQVAGFENDTYSARFYLTKATENDGFLIARWDVLGKYDEAAEADEKFQQQLMETIENAKENLTE